MPVMTCRHIIPSVIGNDRWAFTRHVGSRTIRRGPHGRACQSSPIVREQNPRTICISPMAIAKLCICTCLVAFLVACGPSGMSMLQSAPRVSTGDATISVIVSTRGQTLFPEGSEIVITLADISGGLQNPRPLVGDTIRLSQPDQGVRISLPADRANLIACRKPNVCGLYVRVVKNGRVLLGNRSPVPYVMGQKNITVIVST